MACLDLALSRPDICSTRTIWPATKSITRCRRTERDGKGEEGEESRRRGEEEEKGGERRRDEEGRRERMHREVRKGVIHRYRVPLDRWRGLSNGTLLTITHLLTCDGFTECSDPLFSTS